MPSRPLIPKFEQVINDIQEKILTGEWPAGEKIPSLSQLQKLYGMPYSTLRGAMLVLKTRGLIEGSQGDGVRVTHPGQATDEEMLWLERFLRREPGLKDAHPGTATMNGGRLQLIVNGQEVVPGGGRSLGV